MQARSLLIPALLIATFAAAQTVPTPPQAAPPAPAATAAKPVIPPDAPVITIKGGCAEATPRPADCQAVVTRAQFEALVQALNPEMPENVRQSFAQNYGKLLVIANEARREGVASGPEMALLFEFAKLQVLAQELGKKLQKAANDVPQSDIDAYYKSHAADYQAADLQRLIVPRVPASKEKPADEAAEKAYAEKIRTRWVAGESPVKLQEEAFLHSGNKGVTPPTVELGERRRSSVPPNQASVFDLKAGEISQPFADPSAFYIYKVSKVEIQPPAKVQDEIRKTLAAQRTQSAMERVTKSGEASLNETYFGKVEAPPTPNVVAPPKPVAPAKSATSPTLKSAPATAKPATRNPK